ncbi:MAG: type II secretion system F family protein [Fidelibacterota bacterium]
MPRFNCRIVTDDGTITESILEAESKFDIYDQAEARNEMVLSIKPFKKPMDVGQLFRKKKKVKPEDLESFTTQLSVLIDSGVPLITAIEAVAEQTDSANMQEVLLGIVDKVNSGIPLSGAMAEYPSVFNDLYVNMIKAGESAGVLDEILGRLSIFIQKDMEVSRNIKKAMRYPMMVGGAMVLAFIGTVMFIIPKFAVMFERQDMELPLPTRILLGLSDFMVGYWYIFFSLVFGIIFGLRWFVKTKEGAFLFDLFKLKFPIFKHIVLKSTIARFAHMLETLTHGGVQIVQSLQTAEGTVGNLVISRDIRIARENVEKGISLAESLSRSKWFPQVVIKMISIGEKSGALEKMLENVARQADMDVDARISRLSSAIEPLMTVVMGFFLVILAMGILLPMFGMYSQF